MSDSKKLITDFKKLSFDKKREKLLHMILLLNTGIKPIEILLNTLYRIITFKYNINDTFLNDIYGIIIGFTSDLISDKNKKKFDVLREKIKEIAAMEKNNTSTEEADMLLKNI